MDYRIKEECLSLEERIVTMIENSFDYTRDTRKCGKITDLDFISLGLKRVLKNVRSARDFYQEQIETDGFSSCRSNLHKSWHSKRRLEMLRRFSEIWTAKIEGEIAELSLDYLSDFPQLNDYEIYACDGHFIKHGSHTKALEQTPGNKPTKSRESRASGKLNAAGCIYTQNLRNGSFSLLNPLTDGSRKNHEMPRFKAAAPGFAKQQKRKTIFVVDRGYADKEWWSWSLINKESYFISRTKKSFSLTRCGDSPFDQDDPMNTGIQTDFLAGLGGNSATFRIIDYVDPESNEQFQFYTSLLDTNIPPGLIAWLYFKRWAIEKTFDTSKNGFFEQKAWGKGEAILEVQSLFIVNLYNLMLLINAKAVARMDHDEQLSYQKKYTASIEKREAKAKKNKRTIHPFLKKKNRMPQMKQQFIRAIRNHFSKKMYLDDLYCLLIKRLASYL